MTLVERVRITSGFQRAVRIDSDIHDSAALERFLCTGSFSRALITLADHVIATSQGAFTITGPYGGGKSTLVLTLGALIGPPGPRRKIAQRAVGSRTAELIDRAFRPGRPGWRVVPVMGARAAPQDLIWEGLRKSGVARSRTPSKRLPTDPGRDAYRRQRSSRCGSEIIVRKVEGAGVLARLRHPGAYTKVSHGSRHEDIGPGFGRRGSMRIENNEALRLGSPAVHSQYIGCQCTRT